MRHNHALLRYEPWHTSRTAAIGTAHRLDARNATCAISARASGGRQHTFAIVETLATFHLEMSALNVGVSLKTWYRLVTVAVFQSAMLPYVAVSPPIHALTLVAMLPSVMQRESHLG